MSDVEQRNGIRIGRTIRMGKELSIWLLFLLQVFLYLALSEILDFPVGALALGVACMTSAQSIVRGRPT